MDGLIDLLGIKGTRSLFLQCCGMIDGLGLAWLGSAELGEKRRK